MAPKAETGRAGRYIILNDLFGDPFKQGPQSLPDILKIARGRVRGPRKAEIDPAETDPGPDAEPLAPEEPADEAPSEKVVLRNPKWEVEKVGFNEETDISVEAVLPEAYAHKTRVEFDLFAKTPDGPERISRCQGYIESGKAKGRIPVYIPNFRDEDGNLLQKVEYYFVARHSESDPLDGSKAPKLVDEMAERLLECHILQDVTFATGKSFLSPKNAPALKAMVDRIKEWKAKHADGKLALFGHADAIGQEDPNKKLSERRAASVFAFLTKDVSIWMGLHDEEKWNLATTQELLKFLGHDPGAIDGKDGPKTQEALKGFQSGKGLGATGQADAETRKALYQGFMDACNADPIKAKEFDSIDGKPHAGCSGFNRFENMAGASAANRRVALLFLKSNKNFPIHYPCKQGDIGPCRGQTGRKGARRTAGFGCFFYDKLVVEAPGSAGIADVPAKRRIRIVDMNGNPMADAYLQAGDSDRADPDPEGWCEVDAAFLEGREVRVETGTLALNWSPDQNQDTGVA